MQVGSGYAKHADAYDVGILLYRGKIQTLNQEIEAPATIFYAAGEMHGIRNIWDQPAEYLVFEFHGKHSDIYQNPNLTFSDKIIKAIRHPDLFARYLKRRAKQFLWGKIL